MNFLKLTFGYLKKNFLFLSLYAILPTIFVGVLLHPFGLFEFISKYPNIIVKDYGSVINIIFNLNIWRILIALLGVLILCICMSMSFGQIESHMRSGKVNLKKSASFLNNNFMVIVVNVIIMAICIMLIEFLYANLVTLCHLCFSSLNSTPNIATIIIAILLACIAVVLQVQIVAIFLLNIPNMTTNGYPLKQALSNSVKILNKHNFAFMFAIILPFVVIIPLVCVLAGPYVCIANVVGVFILSVYIPSLVMTGYFSLSNTTRYDNRRYFNYNI